jgi:hypothetical protein
MKKLFSVLCVFAIAAIAAGTVSASPIIVTPAGLDPGAHFRVVFLTDIKMDAIRSSLTYYDGMVTINANGATYNGTTIGWKAIVSNGSTNARDHISLLSTSTIPLYKPNGTLVSSGNLWSGWLLSAIDTNIHGTRLLFTRVWTGSNPDGTTRFEHNDRRAVGDYHVTYGLIADTGPGWITTHVQAHDFTAAVYGISDVFTVPSAVPEPSTVMIAGLGGLAALAYSLKHKRSSCRRQ